PTRSQRSISVDHEDLSVIGCACLVTTPIPEVLTYFRSPRRSQPVWELHLVTAPRTPSGPTTRGVDPENLMAFVLRAVTEVGAALNAALVVMGDRLGYYRSLAAHGASTPAELAERTGTDEHYAREWLNAQAAGAFVSYDPT